VRPSCEAKGINLKTTMDPEGALVSGDANRLQQVFWNLLSNAVKFTPEGGEVRVEVKRVSKNVRIAVSDSGIGIQPEFLPFIFDRFRQADGSTTRVHGGLGLGLSIVKHLVHIHRGTVKVDSQGKNQGATFTLSLPLASESPATPSKSDAHEPAVNITTPGFSRILEGLRILVVDDEADSRDLVKAILTECGGEVKCCESAAEGIQAVKEWKPDLLVSDIGMPVEDGYSLIKKVRNLRSKRAKQLPAVALTAYATKEDKARALSAGFQMHVAKPIEPETLAMSIASVVGRKV
jgi:CheY-like chemotaxis protein